MSSIKLIREIEIFSNEDVLSAKDFFKINNEEINFFKIGEIFEEFYLSGDLKIEGNNSKKIKVYKTFNNMTDSYIVKEIDHIETTLGDLCYFIKIQPNGQEGILLTDGHPNMFFIRNILGEIMGVKVSLLYGHGWSILASRICSIKSSNKGCHIFANIHTS